MSLASNTYDNALRHGAADLLLMKYPGLRYEKLERSFNALNHIAAAIIAFRKVPLTVNIIYE